MPELAEDMYCSQQICIPPTFPYLLRQFAKAAIRTQPNDLLKWSSAYFRCLSLNIPPPVKPRLEYPIPKDHQGLTPGWLRALLFQLPGTQTVDFKVLWDRWIGACLQHEHLIQVLCLGGFQDPKAVPWLRFIALCAGQLTENLTQTMILICEILTEEPEGGSAMISVDVFLDLYKFLAKIDASKPQILRNYFFRDSYLGLFADRVAEDEGPKEVESAPEVISSVTSMLSGGKSAEEVREEDVYSEISCPSAGAAEGPVDYLKMLEEHRKMQGEGETCTQIEDNVDEAESSAHEMPPARDESQEDAELKQDHESIDADQDKNDTKDDLAFERSTDKVTKVEKSEIIEAKSNKEISGIIKSVEVYQDDAESEENLQKEKSAPIEDVILQEDLERLKAIQMELYGESDDEMEKFKASLIAQMKMTPSQQEVLGHYDRKLEFQEESGSESKEKSDVTSVSSESRKDVKADYDLVPIDAIPGIGPIVPDTMLIVAVEYMEEMAKWQHAMVMPRNIRHFSCPPLEILHY